MAQTQENHSARRESQNSDHSNPTALASDDGNISEAQAADKDLQLLISALKNGTGRPSWEVMSSASTETKYYWAQWDMLRMHGGVLQRRWETTDGSSRRWLVVVPRTLRPTMLKDNHDALTRALLGGGGV